MIRYARQSTDGGHARKQAGTVRTPVLILTLLAGLIPVGLAFFIYNSRHSQAPASSETSAAPSAPGAFNTPSRQTTPAPEPGPPTAQTETPPTHDPNPRPAPPAASGPRSLPNADSIQLVAKLTQPDLNSGPITAEKAAEWKENLQQLVQQGAAGTPAIRDFLEKNLDMNFESVNGGKALGQPSLRMALLDALRQIGGPEAMAISAQTLQTTTDPREIAFLARHLDQQAPEQYRDAALKAARESLALATEGKLEAKDVGPLFDVLGQYGGAGAVPDLEQAAARWKYYSAIALADLPEGAGIPSLLQMADPATGGRANRIAALEALAQLSPLYPEARDALLQQAHASQISDSSWITVAGVLAGDKLQIGKVAPEDVGTVGTNLKMFHLSNGNQDFYSTQNTAQLSPGEITERVALIDQLLSQEKNTLTPTATEALQKSRATLTNRTKP